MQYIHFKLIICVVFYKYMLFILRNTRGKSPKHVTGYAALMREAAPCEPELNVTLRPRGGVRLMLSRIGMPPKHLT